MRYAIAERILALALMMQASNNGIAIKEIISRFGVSRRTAVRMRDAVMRLYPGATKIQSTEREKRWRIEDRPQSILLASADELAALHLSVALLEKYNVPDCATLLQSLSTKIRSCLQNECKNRIEPDVEVLVDSQVLLDTPKRVKKIQKNLLNKLWYAIKANLIVEFEYVSFINKLNSHERVFPYKIIYFPSNCVVGYNCRNHNFQVFYVNNMDKLKCTKEYFNKTLQLDLQKFISDNYRVIFEDEMAR